MRFSDRAAGLVAVILGVAVAAYARTFPPAPGQIVGPSLFPFAIGAGLAVLGALLMLGGGAARRGPWIELEPWVRRPRMAAHFVLVVADLLFYALAVDRLGFLITAFVFLAVLFLAFGVRRRWIVPAAAVASLLIHFGFYTLLRVPLPWGVLGRFAW